MNNSFTRSNNNFGPLSTAVLGRKWYGHKSINLRRCRHIYLPVCEIRWPEVWIIEVWYVGDLSGIITIPAFGSGGQYGLSGWTLFAAWRSRRSGRWHHSHVARCSAQCARHGPTLHKELTGYGPDSGAKTNLTGQGKTCPVFFASGHGRGWPDKCEAPWFFSKYSP